jgi:hypothetical protein
MRHEPKASAAAYTTHPFREVRYVGNRRKGIEAEAFDNSDYVRGFGENIIRCYQTTVLIESLW